MRPLERGAIKNHRPEEPETTLQTTNLEALLLSWWPLEEARTKRSPGPR